MSQQIERRPAREWMKFGILAAILVGTILVVATARPFIFNHLIPAVLGEERLTAPLTVETEDRAQPDLETYSVEAYPGEADSPMAYPVEAYPVEAVPVEAYPVETLPVEAYPAVDSPVEAEAAVTTNLDISPTNDDETDDEAGDAWPTAVATITYTVQPGENITQIADKHNVTVNEIVEINNIRDPNYVAAGTTLLIPQP